MFAKSSALKSTSLFLVASSAIVALGFAFAFRWTQANFGSGQPDAAASRSSGNKEKDGLTGPVHRVRAERAKLLVKSGQLVEGTRELLETTTYDVHGNRIDNAYYAVSGSPHTGKEEYRYDDRNNIVEMTMRDPNDNAILSREAYTYEFDSVGNWTKMNTFLVVFEGGKLSYEPTEVTYRNISYYYNQTIADITKPASPLPTASTESSASSAGEGGDRQPPREKPEQDEAMKQAAAPLNGALAEWVAATNARDIDRQMGFYAPTVGAYYRARGVSREFVRADKARVFQHADVVDVRAVGEPDVRINTDGRTATMRFLKQYVIKGGGQDRQGEVVQELRWRLTGGEWRIVSERDVRVVR
jgi:ketosteroid isomerase-like protein